LPENAWERRHELAFELELRAADCEVYAGALQAAEQRLATLATRALSTVQRFAVAHRRVDLYTMLVAGDRAVTVALECLRHLGIDWSEHPTEVEVRVEYERIWSLLGDRAIETLVDLPLMHDPEAFATMGVLTRIFIPAMYTDNNLVALAVCRAANLSLEHGNSDAAPANYEALGIIAIARFRHYDEAYRFGKMACDLVEGRGWKHFAARTLTLFSDLIPWTRPLREGVDPARRSGICHTRPPRAQFHPPCLRPSTRSSPARDRGKNEVIILARSAIMKNDVSVQTRLAEGLLPVQGDRVQLQQVVLNLILNAVEAMASNEARERGLSIRTEQDGTGVRVAVSDTGPGVDPEHREG
jgi:signal transduction histidine kinase